MSRPQICSTLLVSALASEQRAYTLTKAIFLDNFKDKNKCKLKTTQRSCWTPVFLPCGSDWVMPSYKRGVDPNTFVMAHWHMFLHYDSHQNVPSILTRFRTYLHDYSWQLNCSIWFCLDQFMHTELCRAVLNVDPLWIGALAMTSLNCGQPMTNPLLPFKQA